MATHNLQGGGDLLVNYFLIPHLAHAHFYWVCKTFTPPSVGGNK